MKNKLKKPIKQTKLKLENKQKYAQYYSTNIQELINNYIEIFLKDYFNFSKIENLKYIPIIEPCCGEGHIIEYLKTKGLNNFELYDIDPKYKNTIKQDTILNPPDYNNKCIITNPPYGLYRTLKQEQKELYKEYFKDKKLIDNIYKIYINQIINSDVISGILIIPLNFLFSKNKKLRKLFIEKYQIIYANLFQKSIFKDARIEICSFYFKRRENDNYTFPANLITKDNNKRITLEISERNNYFYGYEVYTKRFEIKNKELKEKILGSIVEYKILLNNNRQLIKKNKFSNNSLLNQYKDNGFKQENETEFNQVINQGNETEFNQKNDTILNQENKLNNKQLNNQSSYKIIRKCFNKQFNTFKDNKILTTYRKTLNVYKINNQYINNILSFFDKIIYKKSKRYLYLTNIKIYLYDPLIKAVYSTNLQQDINPIKKIDSYHSYINIVSFICLTENEQKYIISKFNEYYNIYKNKYYSLFMQPVNHEYNMKILQKNLIKIWLNNIIYEMINKKIIKSINKPNIYNNITIFKLIIVLIMIILMFLCLFIKY